ncbi:hypothetical protein BCO71171_06001 [Burkholderia contaminans]|uniref:Uncharacterized protein n=1 Tax=Burkholderia contaminans TaxID=488447 RepID=A0A6P3BCM3_9BURK|nr:hypothetical protein BCO71171_06001 [Burkholderia contaminans]
MRRRIGVVRLRRDRQHRARRRERRDRETLRAPIRRGRRQRRRRPGREYIARRRGGLAMKRERQRHARRAHPVPHRDARFRRPDEQHAVVGQTRVERADHAILRVAIEVDQHVAAEHEIVANAGIHGRFDEVRLTELHARAHALVEQPAVAGRREVPRAKLRRGAAERIAPVAAEPRLLDRARAEVDRVDREAGRVEPRVEQRHRRRIRLLARRARRAQHADHPAGQRGEPLRRGRASVAKASRSRKNQVSGTTNSSISARRSSADALSCCQ